jgi:hypothetical protein
LYAPNKVRRTSPLSVLFVGNDEDRGEFIYSVASLPTAPLQSAIPRRMGFASYAATAQGLFRWCNLFDRRRLSVGLLGWFIRLGQELIDHARTLLLLYSSLLRSLLFGPEFVIYFPAH